MAANYDDVLSQLQAAGLLVVSLEVGRMRRCRVEGGDREARGWYTLHEVIGSGGEPLLVGSFGIWRGNEPNAQKVELRKTEFSREQLDAIRAKLTEDRRRAEMARKGENARAARKAASAWARFDQVGESGYLAAKRVGAHGVRFTRGGGVVVPMMDTAGNVHGLQIIRTEAQAEQAKRPTKEFWPPGLAKKGHFHLLGLPGPVMLVAEGYATAASLHEATGLPVAVAFDAGNLTPVAEALHKRHPSSKLLICADDDALAKCVHCESRVHLVQHPSDCPACGKPHTRSNAGVIAASTAAMACSGAYLVPLFPDTCGRIETFLERGRKMTDFNDLAAVTSLLTVREQVMSLLSAKGWLQAATAAPPPPPTGPGEMQPISGLSELVDRFALVYGKGGMVFDRREHCLVALSDVRDACVSREIHRAWMEHPGRSIVREVEVGFDPAETDERIKCNLWSGWPTTPKPGKCDRLLHLLEFLCSRDAAPDALYRWILKWLALPIQRPGAKLKTSIIVHGPQGAGKNLFFEAVMKIYGHYADVIDQASVEDRFNDWASRKLFLIADEVVARQDLYHIKNKLKGLVTGERIRINPKNVQAYWEANHLNIVFLSNEAVPLVLDEDDRRYAVVWTPDKVDPDYYRAVREEIANGGIEALHDYLLHLDIGEFECGTLPPVTNAKQVLIDLSLDSISRFYYAIRNGDIDGLKARPALSTDVYEAYRLWCNRTGNKAGPQQKMVNLLQRHHRVVCQRKRYLRGSKVVGPHGVLFMDGVTCPDGLNESDWLGEHIREFAASVEDYKALQK